MLACQIALVCDNCTRFPPVCVWNVCSTLKLRSPQVAEKEQSMSADEDDEGSSYGSGHSSEGFLETSTIAVPVGGSEDLAALLGGIAQLARGQAIILEKMSFLEKFVGIVQFDMIRVRDDMTSVHQAMDRFADYVCDIQDAAGDAERLKEQESLEGSARQGWKGKEAALDFPPAPSVSNSHGGGQYERNDVACQVEGGKLHCRHTPFSANQRHAHGDRGIDRDWEERVGLRTSYISRYGIATMSTNAGKHREGVLAGGVTTNRDVLPKHTTANARHLAINVERFHCGCKRLACTHGGCDRKGGRLGQCKEGKVGPGGVWKGKRRHKKCSNVGRAWNAECKLDARE